MQIRHLSLPGLTSYHRASSIQSHLVRALLDSKSLSPPPSSPLTSSFPSPPPPTILTFQCPPIYTTGRRDHSRLTAPQIATLTSTGASFHPALRGGQTTFHGPGQLVAYPILNLRAHSLSTRAYVCCLERAVRRTCAHFGIVTIATPADMPGVWVGPDEKIAALGVHLRRWVSSHGVGINVGTELGWFERIVACGLEGKRVVSFESRGVYGVEVESVGREFVRQMARELEGVDGVVEVGLEDLGITSDMLTDQPETG